VSKLFKLKEWLTVDETVKHLSSVLGEEIVAAEIFRLALDGHLILSVSFPNKALGNMGEVVSYEDATRIPVPVQIQKRLVENGVSNSQEIMIADSIGNNQFVNWSEKVTSIDGVWDLTMLASESIDVEYVYQQLTGGPKVDLVGLDGVFVKRGERYCRLVESPSDDPLMPGSNAAEYEMERLILDNNLSIEQMNEVYERFEADRKTHLEILKASPCEKGFYPAGGLPEDSVYVVRTSAIMDFLNSIEDKPAQHEKPLTTKERNSMLTLIAALCAEAKVDYTQRGIATALANSTETLGSPLTDDTIGRR